MSVGMELGLGPGDFVLDVDTAPPPKRGRSHCIHYHAVLNVCSHTDALRCVALRCRALSCVVLRAVNTC